MTDSKRPAAPASDEDFERARGTIDDLWAEVTELRAIVAFQSSGDHTGAWADFRAAAYACVEKELRESGLWSFGHTTELKALVESVLAKKQRALEEAARAKSSTPASRSDLPALGEALRAPPVPHIDTMIGWQGQDLKLPEVQPDNTVVAAPPPEPGGGDFGGAGASASYDSPTSDPSPSDSGSSDSGSSSGSDP